MASNLPNAILSVLSEPGEGDITVRARIDNLIRYVNIPKELYVEAPDLVDDDDPLVLKLNYPQGVKYLQIYQGSSSLGIRPLLVDIQGVKVTHPVSHDYDSFENFVPLKKGIRDRICIVEHPELRSFGKMIMKVQELPDDSICQEIEMHREVEALGPGIAPKFIGLVTEKGRGVIGFIMEYIEDARSFSQLEEEGYQMTQADKKGCRELLKKLHDNAFLHGDVNKGNILRRADGTLIMIDFQFTRRLNNEGHDDGWPTSSLLANERMMSLETWVGSGDSG